MPSSDTIIIVHTGVGRHPERLVQQLCELCERAADGGRLVGCATGDPTAAVVEAIRILEESPYTNAGAGGNVNRECVVECDASLVEGWSQRGASVGGVPSAPNAILIAHKMVTTDGSPACLVGPGALSWFRENGGEMPEKELVSDIQRKMFRKYSTCSGGSAVVAAGTTGPGSSGENSGTDKLDCSHRMDTVGAVALVGGRIAAGVSSGGIFLKYPGRVGQAGVYGAGCWADHMAGVSTSGSGEHLIRTMLASRCVSALSRRTEQDTVDEAEEDEPPPVMKLKTFLEEAFLEAPCVRNGGVGGMAAGVIGLVYDKDYHICDLVWAHTTANFIVAYSSPSTPKDVLRSEVCPQHDIKDIEQIKVYVSGTTLKLSTEENRD